MNLRRSKQISFLTEVTRELFAISLVLFFLLLTIQDFLSGFVSLFFNLNVLLYIAVLTGLVCVLLQRNIEHVQMFAEERNQRRDTLNAIGFGVAGAVLVYVKFRSMGMFAILISVLSLLLIVMMSLLFVSSKNTAVFTDREEGEGRKK